jgi:cellulose synthase/poly-beta-1,6-N-acetylglucosamine synthase-like glycosyltransferase
LKHLSFSVIVPVFNRPQEIEELLESLSNQDFQKDFEVLVIEDGSIIECKDVVAKFQSKLTIQYHCKENSGPGESRNSGMHKAQGNYFIFLDSDVILPKQYLSEVSKQLETNYTDAFGGPDTAHPKFTILQKAINYSMTSYLTTGGLRGHKNSTGKFQPRSFNMGISKEAFEITQGFSKMRVGEDIDLTFRLWEQGFETQYIDNAYVYHKRRSTLKQFFNQTYDFGNARPMLTKKYPSTAKLSYWFPSIFILGLDLSILLVIFGYLTLFSCYYLYFLAVLIDASFRSGIRVGVLSTITTVTQFLGYGLGFLFSQFNIKN